MPDGARARCGCISVLFIKRKKNSYMFTKTKKKRFKTVRFLKKGERIEKRALDLEIPDGAWPKCQYRCLADSLCG
jgi:hypothetical protein